MTLLDSTFVAWFCAAYVAVFWVFVSARIYVMRRQGISVLTFAPRRPLLNALGVAAFLAIFVVWSGLFVWLAFAPSAFVLFRPWWDRSAEAGPALTWMGIVLAVAAQCLMWAAIVTMGRAWRIGIDDKSPGALVTHGVFRLSRNPIFLGMDAAAVSGFLGHPSIFFLVCAVCLIVGIHIQITGEERHLGRTYGDAYTRYRERTPRYLLFI